MTRRQRRAHLLTWLALAPALGMLLAAALAARPDRDAPPTPETRP